MFSYIIIIWVKECNRLSCHFRKSFRDFFKLCNILYVIEYKKFNPKFKNFILIKQATLILLNLTFISQYWMNNNFSIIYLSKPVYSYLLYFSLQFKGAKWILVLLKYVQKRAFYCSYLHLFLNLPCFSHWIFFTEKEKYKCSNVSICFYCWSACYIAGAANSFTCSILHPQLWSLTSVYVIKFLLSFI